MSMRDLWAWLSGQPTFARGIHPDPHKAATAGLPIEVLPTPDRVLIPLNQHAGAPATVGVKPRTKVAIGDLIGSPSPDGI